LCYFPVIPLFVPNKAGAQQALHTDSPADLIPESITYSRVTGLYYISSINHHKIVTIDGGGHCRDFLGSDEYGYLEGLGLKADDTRGLLWGVSNGHAGTYLRPYNKNGASTNGLVGMLKPITLLRYEKSP
jgi:hypothetical protein